MKTVAELIGVSRSNLMERLQERPKTLIGRPPLPDDKLVAEIKAIIAELPTYGYRRVHAILKRQALAFGDETVGVVLPLAPFMRAPDHKPAKAGRDIGRHMLAVRRINRLLGVSVQESAKHRPIGGGRRNSVGSLRRMRQAERTIDYADGSYSVRAYLRLR